MAQDPFTPKYGIPLTQADATPARLVRGDVYNRAMEVVDDALDGIATGPRVRGSFFVEDNDDATTSPGAGKKAVLTGAQAGPPCRLCEIDGNRLTYVGDTPEVATVILTANVLTAANTTVQLQVRRNGELVAGASKKVRLNVGQPLGAGALAANVALDPGDFLEVWVANLSGQQDVTVTDATLATRA